MTVAIPAAVNDAAGGFTDRGRLYADYGFAFVAEDRQEKASMKLVITSLAVSALVVSLSGVALAQTSLDPNAQGGASGTAGTKTHTDRAKASGSGSATTGTGMQAPGANTGAGASGGVSGQGSTGGSAGGGASGKVKGGGTLGN